MIKCFGMIGPTIYVSLGLSYTMYRVGNFSFL